MTQNEISSPLGRLLNRIAALEAENRRLREACEAALDYFTEKFGGQRTATSDKLRAALEGKP